MSNCWLLWQRNLPTLDQQHLLVSCMWAYCGCFCWGKHLWWSCEPCSHIWCLHRRKHNPVEVYFVLDCTVAWFSCCLHSSQVCYRTNGNQYSSSALSTTTINWKLPSALNSSMMHKYFKIGNVFVLLLASNTNTCVILLHSYFCHIFKNYLFDRYLLSLKFCYLKNSR